MLTLSASDVNSMTSRCSAGGLELDEEAGQGGLLLGVACSLETGHLRSLIVAGQHG